MSFHQDNLKRVKNIRFYFLLLISGVIFYIFSGVILSAGYNFLSIVTIPIWKVESRLGDGFGNLMALLKSKQSLNLENKRLQNELDNTKLRLYSTVLLQQENKELMVQMGREVTEDSRSIIATVLSGPNIPPYESLIIDIGRDQGISVGDRVIYEPNIVLGEISQVYERSSKVKLYSMSGTLTDVLISNSEKSLHTIATGYAGGNFYIELPSDIVLERGIRVLIPGSDIYILGVVDYIEVDPVTASQKVLVKYPINIKNIRFVHVVKISTNEPL